MREGARRLAGLGRCVDPAVIEEAFAALEPYGERADNLKAVARYLVERKN